MNENGIKTFFKFFEYFAYISLFIGCLFFVKGNWDEYKSRATSFIFSAKDVESIKSPTIVICFDPYAKKTYLTKYGLVPEDFVTNDLFEIEDTKKYSKPWQDIFLQGSYRVGTDFKIGVDMRDEEYSIEVDSLELNEEDIKLIQIEEVNTLWSGLCTKIRIKVDHMDTYGNTVRLTFDKSINESDIPQLKVYFTSEENSGIFPLLCTYTYNLLSVIPISDGIIDLSWRNGKKYATVINPKEVKWHSYEFTPVQVEKLQLTSGCSYDQPYHECHSKR